MPKVDSAFLEEPVRLTTRPSSRFGEQLRIADPEGVAIGGDENPEFKLPKMSSLFVVLMTNVLMQVFLHFLPIHCNGSQEFLPDHQISFFIIVPSSSMYAERLGGGETFSGL